MTPHVDGWLDEEGDVNPTVPILFDRSPLFTEHGPRVPSDSEPFFTLLGRDILASKTVDYWIRLAEHEGVNDIKLNNARRIRDEMRKWARKLPD